MATRNLVSATSEKFIKGIFSAVIPTEIPPGFLQAALNSNYLETGGIQKRDGFTTFFNEGVNLNGFNIRNGIEYRLSTDVKQTLIYATGDTGATGKISQITASTITDVKTSLDGTKRSILTQLNDLLFHFNGVNADAFVYNGTTTRQIGITAPTAAPSGTSNANGSLVVGSNYKAAYTYYNSTTGAESSPSPVSSAVTILANPNDGITWTVTAGASATADTIRLYRTTANGNILFLDNTGAIGATSITSTQADSGLTDQISFENGRITDLGTPNYPTVADNRLFVKTANNEIRFSKIKFDGSILPESFSTNAVVSTLGQLGSADDIQGQITTNNKCIVIKNKSIGVLDKLAEFSYGISEDPTQYVYRELLSKIDGVNHFAAASTGDFAFILTRNNCYITDGNIIKPCATSIQNRLKTLGWSSVNDIKISAIAYDKRKQVLFACYDNSASNDARFILKGDYKLLDPTAFDFGIRWSFDTPGTNTSTHPGRNIMSFFSVENTTTKIQEVYFGTQNTVYIDDKLTSDNGSGIYWEVIDRPTDITGSYFKKVLKVAQVNAKGNGGNHNLVTSIIYDLSNTKTSLGNVNLNQGGKTFGSGDIKFDGTYTFPSGALVTGTLNMQKKVTYGQLIFSNTNANQPIDLYNWTLLGGQKRFR